MRKISAKDKLLVGLVLLLLTTGCGLKANPVLPKAIVSQEKSALQFSVSSNGDTIALIWQLPGKDAPSHLNIEKSTLGSPGNQCRDCPRTFEIIGRLPVEKDKNEYRFVDERVVKGNIYSYRLQLCDESGVCRESQTVETEF